MHGPRRPLAIGALLASMLLTGAMPASAAGTTTRYVDSDGHASTGNCNGSGHAFKHIQAAVNASNQDDRVIVCPGTYVEQVTIDGNRDGLTLKSSTPFGATIKAPSSLADPIGATSLVLVQRVDDVTIQGFKFITRTTAPCDHVVATILIIGARRIAVQGNRLLAPGSDSGVCFQLNGIGIQDTADGASTRVSSVRVSSNEIRDAVQAGVIAAGILHNVSAEIIGNSIRAYFGQGPSGTAAVESSRSRLGAGLRRATASPAGGILNGVYAIGLGGLIRGSVRGNVIQGATSGPVNGSSWYYGIIINVNNGGNSGPYLNGPIDVGDNLIRRTSYGMYAATAADLTVRNNTFTNVGGGLAFLAEKNSSVRGNTITAKTSGIAFDSATTGVKVKDNTVSGNGGTCEDGSTGGGTAGTANTWTGNTATVGDNPNGICPTP